MIGLLGMALQVPRSAYRYASITMAIVILVTRSGSAKLVAFHRFFEVALGVAVGLAFLHSAESLDWISGKSWNARFRIRKGHDKPSQPLSFF